MKDAIRKTVFIAEILEFMKASNECEKFQPYSEHVPEINYEYTQRDMCILERIQEDDDLRQYVEKKIGKKAEEIFSHVASEQ